MKKLVLLFSVLLMVYVSGMALEPVRVGLTYPSGRQGPSNPPTVSLTVFDYSSQSQKYPLNNGAPKSFGVIASNLSGGAQFIVGEGDPDWQGLNASVANNATMVRVYLDGVIAAQLKLKDLVNAQQTTGDGSVLNKGITETGGTISTGSDTTNLVIGSQSVQYTDTTNAPETKMFFNDAKASFRAGTVSSSAWDSTNLGQSSVAFGENTKATGAHSFASGLGTVAEAAYEVAVGSYNTDDTPADNSTDKAFSVGNGTGTDTRSNAFVVRKNGNTEVSGTLTVGTGGTNYTLPSARGLDNQILRSNASGVLTYSDLSVGGSLQGNGTVASPLALNLGNTNNWTAKQTFDDASITVPTGSSVTLSGAAGTGNRSLYIDNAGLVTASNGAAARTASGMITGIGTATAATTQTILNSSVTANSVIIVTYQGSIAASHRITGINGGVSFTLEFSASLVAGEKIHYMIINN